jgi:general secretion pathway protein G
MKTRKVTHLGHRSGFTLIELLIVVAIIGIIAAIAVPNLLNALNRGKQKRTMADLRSLALSLESYAVDTGRYPTAGGGTEAWDDMKNRLAETVMSQIVPTYLNKALAVDGWLHPIHVGFDPARQEVGAGSWGKDGLIDGDTLVEGPTHDFNNDIVFLDGSFVKYPDGFQQ